MGYGFGARGRKDDSLLFFFLLLVILFCQCKLFRSGSELLFFFLLLIMLFGWTPGGTCGLFGAAEEAN